jgi:hypothetical protein
VVALLVAAPVPAQRAGLRQRRRQSRARFVALLLRIDVVALVAKQRDLCADRSIDLGVELRRVKLSLDPDLRQVVAQLHIVTHPAALADVDVQIPALRLSRLHRAFDAAHAHYSPSAATAAS